jgi:hypothetical protein
LNSIVGTAILAQASAPQADDLLPFFYYLVLDVTIALHARTQAGRNSQYRKNEKITGAATEGIKDDNKIIKLHGAAKVSTYAMKMELRYEKKGTKVYPIKYPHS